MNNDNETCVFGPCHDGCDEVVDGAVSHEWCYGTGFNMFVALYGITMAVGLLYSCSMDMVDDRGFGHAYDEMVTRSTRLVMENNANMTPEVDKGVV